MNPASQVSAHFVISRQGEWVHPVGESLVAWHAGEHNATHLGIELEQPTADDEFTDIEYAVCARLIMGLALRWGFPLDRKHVLGHDETPQGKRMGKTDPGPKWDWQRFMQEVRDG